MTDDGFYLMPDGREEVEWMRPHRELIDSLPLPAASIGFLHRVVDDVYNHAVEDRSADQESSRRLLGAFLHCSDPVLGTEQ